MDSSASPFDDIRALLRSMPRPDEGAAAKADRRQDGALGSLEDAVRWAASWQGRPVPTADRALVCLFAAAHGSSRDGQDDETRRRLAAFTAGTTATNGLCAASGLGFKAFDLALDLPSGDIAREPALSERDCVATMAFGMEAASGADLLALGAAGLGAVAPSAALLTALYGETAAGWLPATSARGREVVAAAVRRHGPGGGGPLAILASLGGRDLAALAGAIVAARQERVPVILDGLPALAAAAILHAEDPAALDHCRAAEASDDPAVAAVLARTGLRAVLGPLQLPGGEGIGAALALGLVRTVFAANRDRVPATA